MSNSGNQFYCSLFNFKLKIMRNQIKKYCCLLIVLFFSTFGFSQKQFHITIQFVPKAGFK